MGHIFISYSHKDKEYLERLQVHLKSLERDGIIDYWDDTKISYLGNHKDDLPTCFINLRNSRDGVEPITNLFFR